MGKGNFKWALVLSGGGARGLSHVGVINALTEAGYPRPSLIVGTSMGAIVGGLYACGMPAPEMKRFVIEEFNIAEYLESFAFRINGPVGKVFQTGQALASLAAKPGIDRGQMLLELFEKLTLGKDFENTEIPFRCNAVDLFTGQQHVFRSGSVACAMRASMSFPVFFEPFMDSGMCLVDGGLFDNMPVGIAREEGYEHVLAVDVNRFAVLDAAALKTGPQVIYRSIESVLNALVNTRPRADLTLSVTDDATPFSFYRQREFVELGENAVRNNIESLESFFRTRPGFLKRYIAQGL